MEFGDRGRVKTANTPALVGFDPRFSGLFNNPSSDGFDSYGGSDSICCSGLITARMRGGALVDLNVTAEMKIIQFPENIDKFPTKCDKFLKTNGLGLEAVNNIISVGYEDRFKQKMNILSKFIE